MATKHAAAGVFQNTGSEDMIQFKTSKGTVVMFVDAQGMIFAQNGIKFFDGSVQTSAASTTGTNIDGGTF